MSRTLVLVALLAAPRAWAEPAPTPPAVTPQGAPPAEPAAPPAPAPAAPPPPQAPATAPAAPPPPPYAPPYAPPRGTWAAPPPPPPTFAYAPIERRPEPEIALGAGQFFAGAGVALLGGIASAAAAGSSVGTVVLLAVPAGVGGVACAIGRSSSVHEGSCVGPIIGAYVGAFATIPLAYVGYELDRADRGGSELEGFGGLFAGILVGWLVAQPLAATVGWHMTKARKDSVPPWFRASAAPAGPRPRLDGAVATKAGGRRQLPGEVTTPLLAARF